MISPQTTANKLLNDFKLNHLQGTERKQIIEDLEKHFNQVVITTMISFLNEENFEDFKKYLKDNNSDEEIKKMSAQIPGLAEAIQKRVDEEYKIMKTITNETS